MEVIYKDGVKYELKEFTLESEFERTVLSQYRHIFGPKAIIFDKYKIKSSTGIGTIPDAFVLCPNEKRWYVIEIELASHDVYRHIVPQISKFKVALKANRKNLATFFDTEIAADLHKVADWHIATGSHNNIHRDLTNRLVCSDYQLVASTDFWLSNLKFHNPAQISILSSNLFIDLPRYFVINKLYRFIPQMAFSTQTRAFPT